MTWLKKFALKYPFILFALVLAICAGVFFGFRIGGDNGDVNVKTGEWLAGGTIPADAKLYPIMNEDMKMMVTNNADGVLDDKDIWTLTHDIDLLAALDDVDSPLEDTSEVNFLTSCSVDEFMENNRIAGDAFRVHTVQIIEMYVREDKCVEVTYAIRISGHSNNVGEGDYIDIGVVKFKEVNGNWYEDGIGQYYVGEDGSVDILIDDITGKISIVEKEG